MKNFILLLFLSISISRLYAQSAPVKDTLEYARDQAYSKKFYVADSLLTVYNANNADINGLRLHAQVLYWMKEFGRSITTYEKALMLFPDVKVVLLDYGRMLWELNKLSKADAVLNEYLLYDGQNAEANILLAYINYWNDQIKTAKEKLDKVLTTSPGNEQALALLNEIIVATAPYVKSGGHFASDDQPLKTSGLSAEAGWYKSWLLSPIIQFNSQQAVLKNTTYNSSWLQAGNKISFKHSGLSLHLKGGIFNHPTAANTLLTGAASLSLKVSGAITLNAGTERMPYQYTSTSIQIRVMQQHSVFAIQLNKNKKWLGKAAFELEGFDDGNKIQTFYVWSLLPFLDKKNIKLKAGYSFNYSNANKNVFTPTQSMGTIIANTAPGSQLAGYYNPYFSPSNQTVHALLVYAGLQLSKNVHFTSRASVGIVASANQPQLIFAKDQGNISFVDKSYYLQKYTPHEFNNELSIRFTDRLSTAIMYEYNSLLFYTINRGSLHLKYVFLHDKKK